MYKPVCVILPGPLTDQVTTVPTGAFATFAVNCCEDGSGPAGYSSPAAAGVTVIEDGSAGR